MKFQVIFASWLLLIQPTLAIRCYYCSSIDCENQVLMRECPYIYTHCTAAVIDYSKYNVNMRKRRWLCKCIIVSPRHP